MSDRIVNGRWLSSLEAFSTQSLTNPSLLSTNPAIKLLPFFQSRASKQGGMAKFSTSEMGRVSTAFEGMRKLEKGDVEEWFGYWVGKGMFDQ